MNPLPDGWRAPGAEYSMVPFWFWNDDLTERELLRQLADFREHHVDAFVIHPRVGLPRSLGWMSDRLLGYYRVVLEEARRTGMWALLYDEGMYPSGSSSGQVVARNRSFRPRALFLVPDSPHGSADSGADIAGPVVEVAGIIRRSTGERFRVIERTMASGHSVIRGLHFLDEARRGAAEETPEAADLLNGDAVACFIELVYDRFHRELGDYFGEVVRGIFTDEPAILGRNPERGAVPGRAELLSRVNEHIGYDVTPHLASLWFDDEADAAEHRAAYHRGIEAILGDTYYRPLSEWCEDHGIALTGHPSDPDDLAHMRRFQIPGQDIVWRYIEPGKPSAVEGAQSTNAKCAASTMRHLGRRRNLNEYCGAYGHEFTFAEMQWLTRWLAVRGCNLFSPHAFYYSVRGARRDERPPDVGPNSPWWGRFAGYADEVSRYSWLNTVGCTRCDVAILAKSDHAPWRIAKVCFEHQIDFYYLEEELLSTASVVDDDGIRIAGMHYRLLLVETGAVSTGRVDPVLAAKLALLEGAGRLIRYDGTGEEELVRRVERLVPADPLFVPASTDLRVSRIEIEGERWYLLFNEGELTVETMPRFSDAAKPEWIDPERGAAVAFADERTGRIRLEPHGVIIARFL